MWPHPPPFNGYPNPPPGWAFMAEWTATLGIHRQTFRRKMAGHAVRMFVNPRTGRQAMAWHVDEIRRVFPEWREG